MLYFVVRWRCAVRRRFSFDFQNHETSPTLHIEKGPLEEGPQTGPVIPPSAMFAFFVAGIF